MVADETDKTPAGDSEIEVVGDGPKESVPGEVDRLKAELEKVKNDYLYLGAEFENYKKQNFKERAELIRFGGERLIRDLLEVVDNFERALDLEVTPQNLGTFREGVTMIHRELQALLVRHGVHEVQSVGQPFDPSVHEALTSEETDQVASGSIVRVFKKAYKLYDRLLRPAQVVVAKGVNTKKD